MDIPPGGLLFPVAKQKMVWEMAQALIPNFFFIPACECKSFQQILLHKIGSECPHHLMVSLLLNLHS